MNRHELVTPKTPIDFKTNSRLVIILIILGTMLVLPWVAFTTGNGQVTAINPNERIQSLTAPVTGFIRVWNVKEGDRVKAGDPIVQLTDNDPAFLDRLTRERDAAKSGLESAKLMMETANINNERQQKLFDQGLSPRTEFEKAKIEFSKMQLEYAKAVATLTKAETQLSRQSTQNVIAPRDGTIIRIIPGEMGQLIKAGSPIVVFSPDVSLPAVELWVDGNDAALVLPGQKAMVQFEGWPALQIAGWPSLAIGAFPAKVHLVDQASSHQGNFRVLLVPDGAWPSQNILRLGINARGYITLSNSFIAREIWRQLNGFPPITDPIKDELNRMLQGTTYGNEGGEKDKEKDKSKEDDK
jgi:biotin carboxyl carrier protein